MPLIFSSIFYSANFFEKASSKIGMLSKLKNTVRSAVELRFSVILFLLSFLGVSAQAQWIVQTGANINTLFVNGTTILGGTNTSIFFCAGSGTNWYSTPGLHAGDEIGVFDGKMCVGSAVIGTVVGKNQVVNYKMQQSSIKGRKMLNQFIQKYSFQFSVFLIVNLTMLNQFI